jgi:hypothetical protein
MWHARVHAACTNRRHGMAEPVSRTDDTGVPHPGYEMRKVRAANPGGCRLQHKHPESHRGFQRPWNVFWCWILLPIVPSPGNHT